MADQNQDDIDEFRANDGRMGGFFEGANMLLLHHVGAKSGKERVSPLTYQPVDGDYAIFASNYGGKADPAWIANLQANPDTTVEVGAETVAVKARITDTEERDRIWAEQIRLIPPMADYEKQAEPRVIPVVVLAR